MTASRTSNGFGTRPKLSEVCSTHFDVGLDSPYYLRNLNTGDENVGVATQAVMAKQVICSDHQNPSHSVLPIIPATAAPR